MMYSDSPGLERLNIAIREAVEAAFAEPLDDRPTYGEMMGCLHAHLAHVTVDYLGLPVGKEDA